MNHSISTMNQIGLSAAIAGALSTGLLTALVNGAKTAEAHARDLSLDARGVLRVLDVLVAFDVASKEGDRYGASPALKKAADETPTGLELMANLWGHVPTLLRTGRPFIEMDAQPEKRNAIYANVVPGLGRMFASSAKDLASRLEGTPKRILDIGCGSGVWSLAIAERFAGARVTGLDLPDVLGAFKARATEMSLADRIDTIPGDMHHVEVPAKAFDMVVVANVIRLEEHDSAKRLLAKAATAVAPGGSLVVVDAFSDGTKESEQALRIYALHLTIRTQKGRIYEANDVKEWMTGAGLEGARDLPLEDRGPGAIGVLIARRPA